MKPNLKPWQLVYVSDEHGTVTYIGETVSMPTPAGTIMVRLIPGHPGMLNEELVNRCELVEPGLWYVHYASVEGKRAYFPVDMLRRDGCLPVTFKLEQDPERESMRAVTDEPVMPLIVARITRRKWGLWSEGRWKSFGYTLAEMDTECFVQHPHAQEAA